VTKEDVEAWLAQPPPPAPLASGLAPAAEDALKVIPYAGMRLAIGRNMHRSWSEIPRVTLHSQVVVDELLSLRISINRGAEPMERVSVTDLLIKAVAAAVKAVPEINSTFDGASITVHRRIHLGVAVALDHGLVVPVIRDAGEKSLSAVSRELKTLVHRAKAGTLTAAEMSGGTLTITNLGGYGSVDTFNPIINPPQAAIIGFGRSRPAPVVKDGALAAATVMSVSVTHDHRVLDGAPVASFMAALNALIEDPFRALL
jgi:pyruvate dehydrogenase E2 component (dihydrolipoamide acetyltransferase)